MKFYTNKISTNNSGSFSELIKTALGNKQTVKTASSEEELNKTAQEAGINDEGKGKREDKHWVEGSPSDDNGEVDADPTDSVEPAGLDSGKETMSEAEGETKLASDEGDSGPDKGDALKEHQFKSKDSKDSKDSDGNDDADGEDDDADKEACNASAKISNLEKIANLTPKAKARLKAYWSMIYPEAYADAITQDK